MTGVLVTCASEPPGLELCRALAMRAPVIACGPDPEQEMAPLLEETGIRYLQADLSHSRQRRAVLFGPALEAGVDAVLHAPSFDPHRPHGNADTLRELIHLCERHPTIRRFLYRGTADVYRSGPGDPAVIDEEHPVEPDEEAPSWLRDLVEADQAACAHLGGSRLRIAVLRCAELYAEGAHGQLRRWLDSQPCLRPLGFDPVVNLIGKDDLIRAVSLALRSQAAGVFNIQGADTLPLSQLAAKEGRSCLALPDPVLSLAYRLRALAGPSFDYRTNRPRFHFGGVVCGRAALAAFGYQPRTPIRWAPQGLSPPPAVNTVAGKDPARRARGAPGSVLQARA